MLGKQIAHYHIERLLGEGGMGNVYLAKDEKNNRWVAVKSLRANTAMEPQVRQRFRQEASTMAQLHHKNLVQLHDFIADDNGIYLIMEYVEGENLEHFISRNLAKLSPLSIVEMFCKCLMR